MRSLLLGMGLAMTAIAASDAQAQDTTLYVATYVELLPTAAGKGLSLLKAYRDASRKDAGIMRLEVVQRLDRPNQFVILGVWKDKSAFDAHMATAHGKDLGDKLKPLFASPNDQRQHNVLTVAASKQAGRRAIFVVTHVDVPPPSKDAVIPMLRQLAADGRKDTGNVRFDVWQQTNRPNHFTVIETWSSRKAYDAHISAEHTRQFRTKLTPMTGALYDERLYRPVP